MASPTRIDPDKQTPSLNCRIDLLITELEMGGAEKCLTDLACYLSNLGAQVRVISIASFPKSPRDGLVLRLKESSIEIHSLEANRKSQFMEAVRRYRQLIQDAPPRLVQSFLFHANLLAAVALRRSLSPFASSNAAGNRSSNAIDWVAGVRVAEPRWLRLKSESIAFRQARRVVAVSAGARDKYRGSCHVDAAKWIVIPNGISQRSNSPARNWGELGLPDDAEVALFVGRLDQQKGVAWLINTAPTWLEQFPKVHLVLIGSGNLEQELRRSIHQIETKHQALQGRIHLEGWLPEPRSWMALCALLLLPARYEGMPNVCLEAMAEGKPVVAFDVEGVRELLGEESGTQIVRSQDERQWQEAICQLLSNPKLRDDLGTMNKKRVQSEFDLQKQLAKYATLYHSLIEGESPVSG
jgi:glycosyltransferase involved in cell wall biosynthesis